TPNGDALRLGFVDVPGHERFIRNMLAGVGGIDLVLFVIAADEFIKPQTREHFDICRLLGVRQGITVLTKSDLVDSETLEAVKLQAAEFLRGSFLDPSRSPIVAVSTLKGSGLEQLRQEIAKLAGQTPSRDATAFARLPIDRVFTMKGFGTVVTGTLISGSIKRDEELEIFPSKKRARVRGIQVYGEVVDKAIAGQRTALNLAGIDQEELARGMTLAQTETFEMTDRVDVQFRLLATSKHRLKDRARVHFHSYTTETVAEVILRNSQPVAPGSNVFARLKLSEPTLLLPGDRFIIRQFSPVVTIGGGEVLDASPVSRNLPPDSEMQILASRDHEAILKLRVWRESSDGAWLSRLVSDTGWTKEAIESQLAPAVASGDIVRAGEIFMVERAWKILEQQIVSAVDGFHSVNPLASGIGKEELETITDAGGEIFEAIGLHLMREKRIEIIGDLVRLPGRGVVMKDEETESKSVIEKSFRSAGLAVPALKDVVGGLKIDKTRAQKIVTLLLRDKTLIKIGDDLVFHRDALENLKGMITKYKAKSPKINVAQFKDLTGVSRKYAIPLLEFLDRERITRRVGDERVIL
ncbi:MAG TPA: selenocysteine-specific translation elongation factor, partial [Terriglobales bacterium]